ncbi:MAG: T9SS type A sorting domain-containing protein, partial [Flavobacteriales bacterium]
GLGSHPFDVSFKPGRIVEWRFDNILLPDSGTNEAASHGQVNFRIRPYEPLLAGTVISNEASIFFDYNPPVQTPAVTLTAEFSTGVDDTWAQELHIFPNPAEEALFVHYPGRDLCAQTVVTAADGRVCWSGPTCGPVWEVPTSKLSPGAYMLTATGADGSQWIARFVH